LENRKKPENPGRNWACGSSSQKLGHPRHKGKCIRIYEDTPGTREKKQCWTMTIVRFRIRVTDHKGRQTCLAQMDRPGENPASKPIQTVTLKSGKRKKWMREGSQRGEQTPPKSWERKEKKKKRANRKKEGGVLPMGEEREFCGKEGRRRRQKEQKSFIGSQKQRNSRNNDDA